MNISLVLPAHPSLDEMDGIFKLSFTHVFFKNKKVFIVVPNVDQVSSCASNWQ